VGAAQVLRRPDRHHALTLKRVERVERVRQFLASITLADLTRDAAGSVKSEE